MKHFRVIPVALSALLIFSGCSKEKKMEKMLYGSGWNIASMSWSYVLQDSSGQTIGSGQTQNAGTFTFDKGGSGTYDFTVGGMKFSQSFTWSVDKEEVTIYRLYQNLFGNITQIGVSMTGEKTGKNTIVVEGSETQQTLSGSFSQRVFTATFNLTKK